MNKRIIYQNSDGGVAVIVPAGAVEHAIKDVPEGVPFEIVEAEALPDRTFRNAWEKNGATVAVSLPKAKAIAHDKRRAKRAAELAPLDVEATIPMKAAQAEAERQKIRDKYAAMQSAIDAATTVDQLKAVIQE